MDLIDVCRGLTTGSSAAVKMPQTLGVERNSFSAFISGVFGGATVAIQASPDGVIWVDLPDASFTAATIANVDLAAESLRATLTGATGTTSITVLLRY